jgi:ribosomal protein L37AE/L43A
MVMQFQPGDLVKPVIVMDRGFIGVVRDVDPRINKVMVAWGNGSVVQHDPDELMLENNQNHLVKERMSSDLGGARRGRMSAADMQVPAGDNFVGDPETHGIDEPRGGGFSIMQNLQKDLVKEQKTTAADQDGTGPDGAGPTGKGEGPCKEAARRGRNAAYWCAPERTYRMTREEQENGVPLCPKCRIDMSKEPFTKSEKLWTCPKCGFKVPTTKLTTRVTVDVDEQGDVEIDVKKASRRSRMAFVSPEDLANLPRMKLSQIATMVYEDWKNVNYAAKPYLEAMSTLQDIKDNYMADSGSSIVAYFLSNASSWHGEVAKVVKKELSKRLKASY